MPRSGSSFCGGTGGVSTAKPAEAVKLKHRLAVDLGMFPRRQRGKITGTVSDGPNLISTTTQKMRNFPPKQLKRVFKRKNIGKKKSIIFTLCVSFEMYIFMTRQTLFTDVMTLFDSPPLTAHLCQNKLTLIYFHVASCLTIYID